MLTEERHQFILQTLKRDEIVKVKHLMRRMNCSESTVRRDLEQLENEGKLKRIHGGAKRIYHLDEELTTSEKSFKNIQEKKAIGEMAASLIQENEVIFIDAGTTTFTMIPFLEGKSTTVVTNGIQHASLLADLKIDTILIGGKIKHATKAIIGSSSVHQLNGYRFNKVFLGMNGLDNTLGCTTPDPEEAELKKSAHQRTAVTYVLADQSKFHQVSFAKVCELDEISVITDNLPDDLQHYREQTTIKEVAKR